MIDNTLNMVQNSNDTQRSTVKSHLRAPLPLCPASPLNTHRLSLVLVSGASLQNRGKYKLLQPCHTRTRFTQLTILLLAFFLNNTSQDLPVSCTQHFLTLPHLVHCARAIVH